MHMTVLIAALMSLLLRLAPAQAAGGRRMYACCHCIYGHYRLSPSVARERYYVPDLSGAQLLRREPDSPRPFGAAVLLLCIRTLMQLRISACCFPFRQRLG